MQAQVAVLAESPTLKAAIDTYQSEIRRSDASTRAELLGNDRARARKLAAHPSRTWSRSPIRPATFSPWRASTTELARVRHASAGGKGRETVVTLPSACSAESARLALQDVEIGVLSVATALDDGYAQRMSDAVRREHPGHVGGARHRHHAAARGLPPR